METEALKYNIVRTLLLCCCVNIVYNFVRTTIVRAYSGVDPELCCGVPSDSFFLFHARSFLTQLFAISNVTIWEQAPLPPTSLVKIYGVKCCKFTYGAKHL